MVGRRRSEQIRRRASCPRHYSRLCCDRPTSRPPFLLFPEINTFARLYPAERQGINAGLRPVHFLDERISPSTSSLFNTQLATTRAPVSYFLRSYALEITVSETQIILFVSAKIQLGKHISDYQFLWIFWF